MRPGEGNNGSDRVTLIWDDNVVENTWLQITVQATTATGITGDDVFYFGNAIGDTGNSPTGTSVNIYDFAGARDHSHNAFNPAPIHDRFDFNRDRNVNVHDLDVVKNNTTNPFTDLNLITVPLAAGSSASLDSAIVGLMETVGSDSQLDTADVPAQPMTAGSPAGLDFPLIVGVMETVGCDSQFDTTVVLADESPREEPRLPVFGSIAVLGGHVDVRTDLVANTDWNTNADLSTNSDVNNPVSDSVAEHLSMNTDLSTNSDGRIPSVRTDSAAVLADVRHTSEAVPLAQPAHDAYAREISLESSPFSTKVEKWLQVIEPTSVSAHEVAFGEIIEEESKPFSSRLTDIALAHDLAAMMAMRERTSAKPACRDRAVDSVLTEYMYYE